MSRKASQVSQFAVAFDAGFIAVLVFHQSLLALLHAIGFAPFAAYQTASTQPLGLPKFLSLALWGGLWGVIWAATMLRWSPKRYYWVTAIIFGALVVTSVALFVFAPLKGQPVAGGWKLPVLITGLLVNGAWGFGTALLFKGFSR